MSNAALVRTASVEILVAHRDELLTAIYHKLRPVTDAVKRYKHCDDVYVEEVYVEQGMVVIFLQGQRSGTVPHPYVVTLPNEVVDEGDADALLKHMVTAIVPVPPPWADN